MPSASRFRAKSNTRSLRCPPKKDRKDFLEGIGATESGLDKLTKASYKLLNLSTFFTCGKDECRAWTFQNGMLAPQCAGIIHSDFQKGFIKAEIYDFEELKKLRQRRRRERSGQTPERRQGVRDERRRCRLLPFQRDQMNDFRVGYGEDIHRLVAGRPLFLGGVQIPFEKGLLGHSDADCASATPLSDAILGACALGTLASTFPPSDPSIAGIASHLIVEKCLGLAAEKGYFLSNIDLSISCEKPHLAPYIDSMRSAIAAMCHLEKDRVSVKAMTNEGFDAVGKWFSHPRECGGAAG
jgi:2-C-methyl-D-erythritol 2,4-cyclodiphosphate synthase